MKTTTFTELTKLDTCIEKKSQKCDVLSNIHTHAKELLTTKVI